MLKKRSGFTLIELMIAVAIIGVLASVAIPAYQQYIQRAKKSESYTLLNEMMHAAQAYYKTPQGLASNGMNAAGLEHCTIYTYTDPVNVHPYPPFNGKKKIMEYTNAPAFEIFGLQKGSSVYHHYTYRPYLGMSQCGVMNAPVAYFFG
ncbi:MAG: prepilin-type N-terminal cleavage/methylation domain-containing protein, partial [Polyangiales bacterium]